MSYKGIMQRYHGHAPPQKVEKEQDDKIDAVFCWDTYQTPITGYDEPRLTRGEKRQRDKEYWSNAREKNAAYRRGK